MNNRINATTSVLDKSLIILRYLDTSLKTLISITAGISIAAFALGAVLPVGSALNGTNPLLFLATPIPRESVKLFNAKQ